MFNQPKREEKPKIEFKKLKYCVAKKDIGENTPECDKMLKEMGIQEWQN